MPRSQHQRHPAEMQRSSTSTVRTSCRGSGCFFAIALLRHLTIPTRLDFLQASSYSGMGSTGEVRLHKDISMAIGGTDVLPPGDIFDTGLTASWLKRHLASHNPASVHLCTLLDKPSRRRIPADIEYVGFTIPDEFVVGYG